MAIGNTTESGFVWESNETLALKDNTLFATIGDFLKAAQTLAIPPSEYNDPFHKWRREAIPTAAEKVITGFPSDLLCAKKAIIYNWSTGERLSCTDNEITTSLTQQVEQDSIGLIDDRVSNAPPLPTATDYPSNFPTCTAIMLGADIEADLHIDKNGQFYLKNDTEGGHNAAQKLTEFIKNYIENRFGANTKTVNLNQLILAAFTTAILKRDAKLK